MYNEAMKYKLKDENVDWHNDRLRKMRKKR